MFSPATWITRRVDAFAVVVFLVLAIPSSAAGSEAWLFATVGFDSEVVDSTSISDRVGGESWTSSDHRQVPTAFMSPSRDGHADHDVFHDNHCNPQCHSAASLILVSLGPNCRDVRIVLPLHRMSSRDIDVDKAPPKSPFL